MSVGADRFIDARVDQCQADPVIGGVVLEQGQRVQLLVPGMPEFATVDHCVAAPDGGYNVYLEDDFGQLHRVPVTVDGPMPLLPLEADGSADSSRVLAGMWTRWMNAAASNAETTLLASTPLDPYAHQMNAVYGAMLPQPFLRFLLADEPGTGKTIMAGMYLREMQRLGLIRRAIIVVPANLVTKWQADFDRFFGGNLRRITAETVRQHALETGHDMWIVSLELAAMNPAVQDAIRPDKAGWDVVVFDEAHRLTPTATSFHQVGRLLSRGTPRALLMTATPHRGKEWLFRHLLHLVDPAIYPDPGPDRDTAHLTPLRPGPIHFLRRMKEDLLDRDGSSRLFKGRTATNFRIPLSLKEVAIYQQALDMVDRFFHPAAQPLARMVYGKRAASSLHALAETLKRRSAHMGDMSEAEAAAEVDKLGDGDEEAVNEAKVIHGASVASAAERKAIKELIAQIDAVLADPDYMPSKWHRLIDDCLAANGILPGNREQAVVFTEYADTAEWLTQRLNDARFTTRMYSGRLNNAERDQVRADFMRGDYQIIVTTDAGNEGIDLQAAHVLANYDVPFSLVKLEQRMGRIHRVGQTRDVHLYNLVAVDTREGDTLHVLLENFVTAANELGGQMFDSLSAVAEISGVDYDSWLTDLYGNDEVKKSAAIEAARKVQAQELKRVAQETRVSESILSSQVDAMAALTLLQRDLLARINPAIVDAYLERLDQAGTLTSRPTAAGDGVRLITSPHDMPPTLGGGRQALVATSGDVLRNPDLTIDTSDIVPLGPGEPAFTDLIGLADHDLAVDTYRSGAAEDPTSITPYDLYAFEASLEESGGRRTTAWAALIRVDDSGSAYPVRWESLANLTPSTKTGGSAHPARELAAISAAAEAAQDTVTQQQEVRSDWFSRARHDLQNLPFSLTLDIEDKDQRIALRDRLEQQTTARLTELEALSHVTITSPRLAARIRVHPAAEPLTKEEKDSEWVAMKKVAAELQDEGWKVDDVSSQNRGYDIHAVRGSHRRLVEVKGVWESAGADGIRMTGNEVLMATQHRDEYWLYVVDQCSDGAGTLFGAYRDPATLFAGDMRGDAIFRVPGASLSTARGAAQ